MSEKKNMFICESEKNMIDYPFICEICLCAIKNTKKNIDRHRKTKKHKSNITKMFQRMIEKDITFQKHEDTSNVKKCVEVIEGYFKCPNCKDNTCLEDCEIINFDYVKCYECKEIFEWYEE